MTLAPYKIHWERFFCHLAGEPAQFLSTLRQSLCYNDNMRKLAIYVIVYTSVGLIQQKILVISKNASNAIFKILQCTGIGK